MGCIGSYDVPDLTRSFFFGILERKKACDKMIQFDVHLIINIGKQITRHQTWLNACIAWTSSSLQLMLRSRQRTRAKGRFLVDFDFDSDKRTKRVRRVSCWDKNSMTSYNYNCAGGIDFSNSFSMSNVLFTGPIFPWRCDLLCRPGAQAQVQVQEIGLGSPPPRLVVVK